MAEAAREVGDTADVEPPEGLPARLDRVLQLRGAAGAVPAVRREARGEQRLQLGLQAGHHPALSLDDPEVVGERG